MERKELGLNPLKPEAPGPRPAELSALVVPQGTPEPKARVSRASWD